MAVYNSQHPYMFWRGKPLIIGVALGLLLMAAISVFRQIWLES